MSSEYVRRGMCCAVMASVLSGLAVLTTASALTGCSTVPKTDDPAARQAAQAQLNERMAAADKALKQGQNDQAIEQLDQAIKADPSSKEPWLKKAQIHFDGRQYGQAITESQEVLQRDVNDLTAKSILAVSGLRVSAQALEQLRKANEVNGPTRSEAESVARLIREALGEPILVPTPAAAAASEPVRNKPRYTSRSATASRSAPLAANMPAQAAATAPTATAPVKPAPAPPPKSTGAASGGRNNPFGALQ